MCLKASDYKGCIEAQLERRRKPISSVKPVRSKVEDYEHYPKYRTDQADVFFFLATSKCSAESDVLSKPYQKLVDKMMSKQGLDKSILKHKSVKLLSSQYAKKNYGKCDNIGKVDYDELLYSLHKINQSSNLFNSLTKENFVKPTCEIRNSNDFIKLATEFIPCTVCYQSYEENIKGNKSILSGLNKEELTDQVRPIAVAFAEKGKLPRDLSIDEFTETFTNKVLERAEKLYCPALY